MIKLFRKIRQHQVAENQLSKYLFYATGEIVLVVIGILIALWINNQNEKGKINSQFKTNIEEIYNSIKFDVERLNNIIQYREGQLKTLMVIINHPDSLSEINLIKAIYNISGGSKPFLSETGYFLDKLNPDPENPVQNELVREVNNYVNQLQRRNELLDDKVYQMLREEGIPYPLPGSENRMESSSDSGYYTVENYKSISKLMKSDLFLSELKTLAVNVFYDKSEVWVKKSNGTSLLNRIKNHYPEVKPLFKDVGIIGTAIDGFDDVGAISTPMTQTDDENSIWEIELFLKAGMVKFRCRDSWAQNWGGDNFPEGNADYDGGNIRVPEAGTYHVTLNLSESKYQFIRIKGQQ